MKENHEFKLGKLLIFIIISYTIGHLLNFISSITIEKYALWTYGYPSKYLLGFSSPKYHENFSFSKFFLLIIILPVSISDLIIGELFKFKKFYTKKLDELLIQIIKNKSLVLIDKLHKKQLIDKDGNVMKLRDYDFFRIYAHYTYENSKNHQFKMTNYVVLYGFLRTISFIFVLLFWYILTKVIIIKYSTETDNIDYSNYHFFLILSIFVSYISFMAFMKFYRRYTLEGLMLVAIDRELEVK